MKKTSYLIAACMIVACAAVNGDTLYPGFAITSATVARDAGGRLIIPVFVDNNTGLWAQVFTTSSPIATGLTAYNQRIPYVSCRQGCIGQDMEFADFFAIPPDSTACGIADEFNWSLDAPAGYEWTGLLDGQFSLSPGPQMPPVEFGTFQIDFQAVVLGPLSAVPEPSTFALAAISLLALAVVVRRRQPKACKA